MARSLKTLRTVQWAMLFSILLYIGVGEILGPRIRHVEPALSGVLSTLAVGIVGTIFVVRRTLVFRAASTLASAADNGATPGSSRSRRRRRRIARRGCGAKSTGW